jgi:hypothetical protein
MVTGTGFTGFLILIPGWFNRHRFELPEAFRRREQTAACAGVKAAPIDGSKA